MSDAPILIVSPAALLAQQRFADLIASIRDVATAPGTQGILSGPGNNGSANTAHMAGQAGTRGDFLGSVRQLQFGQSGTTPQ